MTAERNNREEVQHDADGWPPPWLAPPAPTQLPPGETPSLNRQPRAPTPNPLLAIPIPPANFDELLGRTRSTSPAVRIGQGHKDFCLWSPADGKILGSRFAFHVETTAVVAYEVPEYILGAAADDQRGFFVSPECVFDFLQAHWGQEIILHNCPNGLAVINALLKAQGRQMDIYAIVDGQKIWDTQIMHRLYSLGTEGHTCQGQEPFTLSACVQRYLGITLPEVVLDADHKNVRTSWGKWKNRPVVDIASIYLNDLRTEVLCILGCLQYLLPATHDMFDRAHEMWGFVDDNWLDAMMMRYGPQTHDLQVMAAVALQEIERVGVGVDLANRHEIVAALQQVDESLGEELRGHGYRVGEPGCQDALQAIIRKTLLENPDIKIPVTANSKNFSTKDEDLDRLAEVSKFFTAFKEWRQVNDLLHTFLEKMCADRIHPQYDLLKITGRTSSSNPNIQGFPRRKKKKGKLSYDIRRFFVPGKGKVFYIADYASIELRTLSEALFTQFKLNSWMAWAINQGADVHRLVAARMKATGLPNCAEVLADPVKFAQLADTVTAEERDAAKPANFGLPAGMGVTKLRNYARAQFDQEYSDGDAEGWRTAWLTSFPEMKEYLDDKFDLGLALAKELNLTLADFLLATEGRCADSIASKRPVVRLGGMAKKVLREPLPATGAGRAYSPGELDFFWSRLQQLASRLDPKFAEALRKREPSNGLAMAVEKLLNPGVFTLTGRLRAKASFTEKRNTVFQGAAADGAKLALYRLWRAGFRVVAFIHDEVVIEVPSNTDLALAKQQIDDILVASMREICPDMRIDAEGAFYKCWSKDKADLVSLDSVLKESKASQIAMAASS